MTETIQQIPQRLRKDKPNKYHCTYGMFDVYKYFMETHGTPKKTGVDRHTYTKIVTEFNEFLVNEVIHGQIFYMPYKLGALAVKKTKGMKARKDGTINMRTIPVDYKATMEYWKKHPEALAEGKLIRHLNEHTDGYTYRIYWDKRTAVVQGCRAFTFRRARHFQRGLSAFLKTNEDNQNFDILYVNK